MPELAHSLERSPGTGADWHQDLSIVVPSYNARDLLRKTLQVVEAVAPAAEVVVCDGSSADGSAAMVRSEFPWVKVLEHPNHGFAYAINTGTEAASRRFILWLNSDLFLTTASLEAMHRRLCEEPRLGAVAPRLVNVDGSRQFLFAGMYWPLWAPIREHREVAILCAACLMTRRDVVDQVGGMDENLFLFNEERDWCQVVRSHGFALELLGEPVVHVGGGSRRPGPMVSLEERRGYLYVIEKHRWRSAPLIRLALTLQAVVLGWLDPRREWRQMWRKQRELLRGEVRRSLFPVSGRGLPAGSSTELPKLPPAPQP
ncbi:MAG TPA: glycosyltransferase family 2 protein [Myxococcales bacterium]|jgi:hypothetical protein